MRVVHVIKGVLWFPLCLRFD